ncbi:MAG: hypothetical protein VX619_03165 [bacterium]|nr:hypothetical protein [bacterium]
MLRPLFILLLFSVPTQAVQYDFSSGWNLFSPILSSPAPVDTYLTSIGISAQNDVTKIWNYDSSVGWRSYVPGGDNSGSSRFEQFEANKGYWVLMNSARSANLSDAYNSYSLLLAGSGWKLIGLSSSQSVPLDSNNFLLEANFSSGSINDIRKIWGYDGAWTSFTPTEASNSLTSLDPGKAYWFLMLSDLEMNSQNVNLSDLFPPACPGCPSIGN